MKATHCWYSIRTQPSIRLHCQERFRCGTCCSIDTVRTTRLVQTVEPLQFPSSQLSALNPMETGICLGGSLMFDRFNRTFPTVMIFRHTVTVPQRSIPRRICQMAVSNSAYLVATNRSCLAELHQIVLHIVFRVANRCMT
jgi:hypothetical protein